MSNDYPAVALADLIRSLALLIDDQFEIRSKTHQSQIAMLIAFPDYVAHGGLDVWDNEFNEIGLTSNPDDAGDVSESIEGLYELATCNLYAAWDSKHAEAIYQQLADKFDKFSTSIPGCIMITGWIADDPNPPPRPA